MMKIIILLISFAVLASASYEKAKAFYDAKEYQKAVDEARASTSEYANPKLHLVWAESEEALGHTKQAMSAYERVVMLDDKDVKSRMKLLKIYNNSHRSNLAKDMQKELTHYQLTPEQRSSLELLEGEEISSLKAKATLSAGYDTNINVSADADTLNSYYGTTDSEGEIGTLFTRMNGSLSYINDLDEKGGWYARGDVKLYYQANFDAHRYDMFVGGVAGGIGYAGSGYTLYVPIGYDRVYYLGVDMLGQIKITPKVNITLNQNFILNLNAKYALRTYQEDKYKGMGDSSYGGGAGLYYLFDKNFAYMNFLYEDYSSTEASHYKHIDRTLLTATLGVNYNVADLFVARLDYRYRKGDFDDSSDLLNSAVTTKRADDYNQVELKLSHYFQNNYELFISDRYVNNSSNYKPAQYSKNIAMFGLSANY